MFFRPALIRRMNENVSPLFEKHGMEYVFTPASMVTTLESEVLVRC